MTTSDGTTVKHQLADGTVVSLSLRDPRVTQRWRKSDTTVTQEGHNGDARLTLRWQNSAISQLIFDRLNMMFNLSLGTVPPGYKSSCTSPALPPSPCTGLWGRVYGGWWGGGTLLHLSGVTCTGLQVVSGPPGRNALKWKVYDNVE